MSNLPTIHGIQYLRGIAALLVVFHHSRNHFPYAEAWSTFGSTGVDIFFVISGFIMAYTTQGLQRGGWHTVSQFLRKRIVRIVPLYWLALLAMMSYLMRTRDVNFDLFVLDFMFIPHYSQAVIGHIYPLLVPGWTLNYEMFFYVLFCLSLFIWRGRYILLIVFLIAIVCLGLLLQSDIAWLKFYTRSIILEFALGVLVFLVLKSNRFRISRNAAWVTFCAAAAVLFLDNSLPRIISDGVPAAVIVYATLYLSAKGNIRVLETIGNASYSIYLFHVLLLAVVARPLFKIFLKGISVLGIHNLSAYGKAIVGVPFYVAVAALGGILIYRLIEEPILRAMRK